MVLFWGRACLGLAPARIGIRFLVRRHRRLAGNSDGAGAVDCEDRRCVSLVHAGALKFHPGVLRVRSPSELTFAGVGDDGHQGKRSVPRRTDVNRDISVSAGEWCTSHRAAPVTADATPAELLVGKRRVIGDVDDVSCAIARGVLSRKMGFDVVGNLVQVHGVGIFHRQYRFTGAGRSDRQHGGGASGECRLHEHSGEN